MTATKTIGTAVLDRLHELGVRHMFGIPGDYVLGLYKLMESSPIRHVGTTREDCAGFAADARAWADTLGRTGRFEHAPRKRGAPQGENLWAGTRGYYSPEAMVGLWIAEKRNFRPGRFPNNSRTGRVADVGHYTQLMWRSSQQVGCAVATGAAEDVLVCRYSTPGNILGQTPF